MTLQIAPLRPRSGSSGVWGYQYDRATALATGQSMHSVGGVPAVTIGGKVDPRYRLTTTLFPTGPAEQAMAWLDQQAQEAIRLYDNAQDLVAVPRLRQSMRYGPDGFIGPHADDSAGYPEMVRIKPERSLSAVLYLNDQGETEDPQSLTFTGGDFVIVPSAANLGGLRHSPRAGDCLFFPGSADYAHYSTPVTSQTPRYVIAVFYEAQLAGGGHRMIDVPA